MNPKIRDFLNASSRACGNFVHDLTSSCSTLARIAVLSRFSVASKSKSYKSLKKNINSVILANGSSLKSAYDSGDVHLDDCDVFCVNMLVDWEHFKDVKPRFYFVSDGVFFNPTKEKHHNLISRLATALKSVDWEIFLCIPAGTANGGLLKELSGSNVKILRWNTTTTEGFTSFCHWIYRHNMGMPRCQTVTNAAIMAAINMGYANINLYGADHSWTRDLKVNDNNEVCYGDRHVYAAEVKYSKNDRTIGWLLHAFANMFDAHHEIEAYAKKRGVKIWNCTKGSFVDAYERLLE